MAQHDYNIANQSGASFRSDLNNALSAIVSLNSGATAPSTTFAYQLWADTTAGVLKIRNAANNAWITLAELDGTLTMEAGTAGSPGLYFRGDANTGIFSTGADEFNIATGGLQRLLIDSSGRVGIGTQSPGSTLDVKGTVRLSGSTSGYVGLAPAAAAGSTTYTLPTADGSSGQVLSTNGSGTLSWATDAVGFRNRIINGNFDIWQRGTSFAVTTDYTYTADRWAVSFNGSGATRTISRQAFTLGQTDVPGEPEFFLRFAQSVAGTGATVNRIDQRIEDVRSLAGQQATISFWAKAAASTTMPSVIMSQYFGTGGSPSASVNTTAASNIALTTAWQKFTYTVTLPSLTGKTIGADNNNSLIVLVNMPLNATFTIDIAQVQIEPGPAATPFECRPIATELALCERYYEKSYNQSVVPGSATEVGAWESVAINTTDFYDFGRLTFRVRKRGTPSVTTWSTDGVQGQFRNLSSNANQGNSSVSNISEVAAHLGCSNSAMTATNAFRIQWAASAEL